MRWISISELQKNISREFKELPFGVTLYGKKWAKVVPEGHDDSQKKPISEMKSHDIVDELLGLGIEHYRDNPDKITPNILVRAVQLKEGLEKEGEMEKALFEATEEVYGGKKEELPEEEVDRGEN